MGWLLFPYVVPPSFHPGSLSPVAVAHCRPPRLPPPPPPPLPISYFNMRWSTLVIPVTLFYSLSLVYAIPYDADEKRQRLDKRQGISVSPSSSPVSDIAHSSSSEEARSSSSLPSPTLTQDTPNPPSISSTPTQGLPSSTPSPSSGPSSTNSDSSSSTSSSSSS